MRKLLAQLAKADVMHLTKATDVPASEVSHVVVDEEIVRLHIVSPTVFLAVPPAIALAVYNETTDKKLFHRTCVNLVHAVELTVALEYSAHCLAKLLLVSVSCRAGRLLRLAAEHADDVSHKPSYHVVLQWYVALLLDVFALGHFLDAAIFLNGNDVVPLVTVGIAFVALTLTAEVAHLVPIVVGFHQNVVGSAVGAVMHLSLDTVQVRCFIATHTAHRVQTVTLAPS